jgi:hypothetical protein
MSTLAAVNLKNPSSATNNVVLATNGDLQFNSGYGSAATAYGCRAWVNFNGTGTVAIRASGNVSSITDNGTGNYTVNFTTAMPDANYSTVANAATGASNTAIVSPSYSTAPATGSHRIGTYNTNGLLNDNQYIFVAVFR